VLVENENLFKRLFAEAASFLYRDSGSGQPAGKGSNLQLLTPQRFANKANRLVDVDPTAGMMNR
jgi:hypothetical protein